MTLNFSSLKALQVHSSTVRCLHHAKRTLGYFCWVTPDSDSVAFSIEKNFKFIIVIIGSWKNIIWNNDAGLENLGEVVVVVLGGGRLWKFKLNFHFIPNVSNSQQSHRVKEPRPRQRGSACRATFKRILFANCATKLFSYILIYNIKQQ